MSQDRRVHLSVIAWTVSGVTRIKKAGRAGSLVKNAWSVSYVTQNKSWKLTNFLGGAGMNRKDFGKLIRALREEHRDEDQPDPVYELPHLVNSV